MSAIIRRPILNLAPPDPGPGEPAEGFEAQTGFSVEIIEGTGFQDSTKIRIRDLSGQNRFGTKPNDPKPVVWLPYDDNLNPSTLGRFTGSLEYSRLSHNENEGPNGRGCAKSNQSGLYYSVAINNTSYQWNSLSGKYQVWRRIKRTYDPLNYFGQGAVNWKIIRGWNPTDTASWYVATNNGNIGQEGDMGPGYTLYPAGVDGNLPNGQWEKPPGDWQTQHFMWQANSGTSVADGILRMFREGRRAFFIPYISYSGERFFKCNGGSAVYQQFLVHDVPANVGSYDPTDEFWADDVYADDSWCRVMAMSTSTDEQTSEKDVEIFIPSAWSSSQIDCVINKGELTTLTGQYLHVWDNDNNRHLIGEFVGGA